MQKLALSTLILLSSFSSFASQSKFENLINKVISPYLNQLENIGDELDIDINWKSNHPNASVSMKKNRVVMSFHGGFKRKFNLSDDAYAITVCHEVGHLVGGYPKVYPTQKYSAEAQSDYFATSECIQKYFEKVSREIAFNELILLDKTQRELCQREGLESNNCLRGLVAIASLSNAYNGEKSINKYSDEYVKVTNYNDYPSAQCRVDTLRAGLLCGLAQNEGNNCESSDKVRPKCWYHKESDELTPKWKYEGSQDLPEAQIMGEIGEVTPKPWGCHVEVSDISFHAAAYFAPLSEYEIMTKGFDIIGPCVLKKNSDFSGAITKVKGRLFYNINPTDK